MCLRCHDTPHVDIAFAGIRAQYGRLDVQCKRPTLGEIRRGGECLLQRVVSPRQCLSLTRVQIATPPVCRSQSCFASLLRVHIRRSVVIALHGPS